MHPRDAVPRRYGAAVPCGGYTAEQLVAEFPELELDDIRDSLRYAAWLASGRVLALPPAASSFSPI